MLDVVFGRYAGAQRATGPYLAAVGVVIVLGQALVLLVAGVVPDWNPDAVLHGVFAGAVVLLANALLVESLAGIHVSLGSTIYRLNTIAVVLYAILVLGEAASPAKIAGVALGVFAVCLLYHRGARAASARSLVFSVWLVVAAALLRAAFGLLSKVGVSAGTDPLVFMLYVGGGWTLAAFAYSLARGQRSAADRGLLTYAIPSGVLVCLVATFLLLGLRRAEASIVIPIANMSFVVAMLVSAMLGMERISGRKVVAVACAAAAIVLLTRA